MTELRGKLHQKDDLLKVFEEELRDVEEMERELETVRAEKERMTAELDKLQQRIVQERRLFMKLEDNYKTTIIGLNNEKEDALIKLSEIQERARKLDTSLKESREVTARLAKLAKQWSSARERLAEMLVPYRE